MVECQKSEDREMLEAVVKDKFGYDYKIVRVNVRIRRIDLDMVHEEIMDCIVKQNCTVVKNAEVQVKRVFWRKYKKVIVRFEI